MKLNQKQMMINHLIKHQSFTRTAPSAPTKQLEIGNQVRTLTLKRESVDVENRTVELSFSSETAVERWWGMEILGHGPGECDLSRLNNSGAFLMDHMMNDQRGVVENAWLDKEKGRAIIRLSNSTRGQELLEEMRDGIRPHISVGYRILEIIHTKRDENDVDWYRATKWQPYEISSVSVPADTAVGLGRQADDKPQTFNVTLRGIPAMDDEIQTNEQKPGADKGKRQEEKTGQRKAPGNPTPAVDPSKAVAAERQRCAEITAMGREFGLGRQADDAIANDISVDEFRKDVLKAVRDGQVATQSTDIKLDLTDKEKQRYSLVNAVRANISGNWKDAGFEREVSQALSEKMGKDSRGFMVNYEVMANMGRAQNTQTQGAGGALVADEHHSEKFIELLRPRSVAAQLGVRMVSGLVGNVDIPKMLSGSSFYWIDEGADSPESEASFGIVQMSPKTITGSVPITRRLMQQSTPDIDLLIRDDLLDGLALGIDQGIIAGSGTGFEPLGIKNQTGIHAIDLDTLGLSHAGLVAFETEIEEADALSGGLQYLTRPRTKGTLKVTPRNANSERYLWEENQLNGYSALCSKHLDNDAILAGDFSQAMFGTWGVLDLMVDKSTKAASAGTVLRVFQDGDVALRHPKAFAYGKKTAV